MALRWPWNILSCKFNTKQYEKRRPSQRAEEQTSAGEDLRLELVVKEKFKSPEYAELARVSSSPGEKGHQCGRKTGVLIHEAPRISVLLEHQVWLETLSGEG